MTPSRHRDHCSFALRIVGAVGLLGYGLPLLVFGSFSPVQFYSSIVIVAISIPLLLDPRSIFDGRLIARIRRYCTWKVAIVSGAVLVIVIVSWVLTSVFAASAVRSTALARLTEASDPNYTDVSDLILTYRDSLVDAPQAPQFYFYCIAEARGPFLVSVSSGSASGFKSWGRESDYLWLFGTVFHLRDHSVGTGISCPIGQNGELGSQINRLTGSD
jgi:hypothetical protein